MRKPWTLAVHAIVGERRIANATYAHRYWTWRGAWKAAKAQNRFLDPRVMWLPKRGESW